MTGGDALMPCGGGCECASRSAKAYLHGNIDPCWEMSHPHGRLGCIHVLPACSGGPVHVDSDVLIPQVDVNLAEAAFPSTGLNQQGIMAGELACGKVSRKWH